jgi:site-specific DNA-methyltransferase (adenine-specific)
MDPYYEHAGITIYHGDCRELLPSLKADVVVTDPPYGVGYRGGHFNDRKREALVADDDDVYAWAVPLCFSCCVGPCYFFFAGSRARNIYNAVHDSGGMVHALIIWHKTNGTYAAMNAQYKQRHEPILYCKGPRATTRWRGRSDECTVWDMRRDPENVYHPTQKPVWLMSRAINNHEADVVLDPFMGAGSALLAAKELGRRAIGIEIEEKYCEIAAKRLTQEVFDWG